MDERVVSPFGGQTQQTTPQASFEFEYDGDVSLNSSAPLYDGGSGGELTIHHGGGDTLPADCIVIRGSGGNTISSPFTSDITAETIITVAMDRGDTARIVYTATDNTESISGAIAAMRESNPEDTTT